MGSDDVQARVVVLAGPSGAGKSRLAGRVGMPVLRLDDFYKSGDDTTAPRLEQGDAGGNGVDWDDPRSWDEDAACVAIESLCRTGQADVPVYDIAANAPSGSRTVTLDGAAVFLAEGLFAPQVVAQCRRKQLLADAICVRHHRAVTFVLRLLRDLREHRKPPPVLVRRGWRLMRAEPRLVAETVAAGCRPMSPRAAEAVLRALA